MIHFPIQTDTARKWKLTYVCSACTRRRSAQGDVPTLNADVANQIVRWHREFTEAMRRDMEINPTNRR